MYQTDLRRAKGKDKAKDENKVNDKDKVKDKDKDKAKDKLEEEVNGTGDNNKADTSKNGRSWKEIEKRSQSVEKGRERHIREMVSRNEEVPTSRCHELQEANRGFQKHEDQSQMEVGHEHNVLGGAAIMSQGCQGTLQKKGDGRGVPQSFEREFSDRESEISEAFCQSRLASYYGGGRQGPLSNEDGNRTSVGSWPKTQRYIAAGKGTRKSETWRQEVLGANCSSRQDDEENRTVHIAHTAQGKDGLHGVKDLQGNRRSTFSFLNIKQHEGEKNPRREMFAVDQGGEQRVRVEIDKKGRTATPSVAGDTIGSNPGVLFTPYEFTGSKDLSEERCVRQNPSPTTRTSPGNTLSDSCKKERLQARHISAMWPHHLQPGHASRSESLKYPLHVKKMKALTLEHRLAQLSAIDRICGTRFSADWKTIIKTLFDNAGRIRAGNTNLGTRANTETEMLEEDIKRVLEAGYVTENAADAHVNNCRVFSVVEEKKGRRRWITHTPGTNKLMNKHAKAAMFFSLEPPGTMRGALKYQFAGIADFKAYYNQFGLSQALSLWGFSRGEKNFLLQTIPTGANFCPKLAHSFTLGILGLVKKKFPLVHCDAYIDNVRFSGENEIYVGAAIKYFFNVCKCLCIEINESEEEVRSKMIERRYEFLGVVYDHKKKTSDLGGKMKEKISQISSEKMSVGSVRSFLSDYGVLGYAADVLGLCRGRYYFATKFLRRKCSEKAALEDKACPWPVAISTMLKWKDDIEKSGPRKFSTTEKDVQRMMVYTDASDNGFGAVGYSSTGATFIFAGRWSPKQKREHINIKEAIAVLLTLKKLASIKKFAEKIELKIDNTSAMFSLTKGASRSYKLNRVVTQIWDEVLWKQVECISYVRSEENHADLPSRLCAGLFIISDNPFMAPSLLAGMRNRRTNESLVNDSREQ